MGHSLDDDPLAAAIAPPPDETPEQRQEREHAEEEARRISDEIDEQLRNELIASRKRRSRVKVLLLGQSESGTFSYIGSFRYHGMASSLFASLL